MTTTPEELAPTIAAIHTRLTEIETYNIQVGSFNKTIQEITQSNTQKDIKSAVMDLLDHMRNQEENPPVTREIAEDLIDAKIRSAMVTIKAGGDQNESYWKGKSILESKAMQDVGKVIDAKTYRQWNRKMKNAL